MRRLGSILWLGLLAGLALAVPVTFRYRPPAGLEVRSVTLRGRFNRWGQTPMKPAPDGSWSVTLDLAPGEYAYKFFINGRWPKDMCQDPTFGRPMVDPQANGCEDDGFGGKNAVRIVRAPAPKPGAPAALDFRHDPRDSAFVSRVPAGVSVRFWAGAGSVRAARLLTGGRTATFVRQLRGSGLEVWRALLPDRPERYRIEVTPAGGPPRVYGPYQPPAELFLALAWVGQRAGYQVFPERFKNGDPENDRRALFSDEYNFNRVWQQRDPHFVPILSPWNGPITPYHCCHQYFGGDLAGLLEKLPDLARQGVGLLYLNPVFEAGSAHGYDTHDYLKVAAKFGDKALLRRVLRRAHALGIRVLFDFVPNHTGLGFWAFRDVVRRGPNSPYWNWYFVKRWPFLPGDGRAYTSWWNVASLPKLNTGDPGVRRYLIEVAKYWLRFGFDGVRVDVPTELIRARAFFAELKAELRRIKPDAYVVGEIWDLRPDWVGPSGFDSLMNYHLGRKILLPYAKGKPAAFASGRRALARLAEYYRRMPEAAAAMGFNLIASHDTSRLLTDLGGGRFGEVPSPQAKARERLALALLFGQPGVPVVWQGDDCAFLGEKAPYDKERYPIQWDRCDRSMRAFYRLLADLKGRYPALKSSLLRTYYGRGPVLAFFRGEPGPGEMLLAFNNGPRPARLPLPPGAWQDVRELRTYRGALPLPPLGWRYLRRR